MLLSVVLVAGGVALGVGLNTAARKQHERTLLLARATGRTEGRITRLWRQGSGDKTRCYASYLFAAGAASYGRTARIGCSIMRTLREGELLPVRFVDSEPSVSRLEELEGNSDIPLWLPPVLPVVFASFAVLIWRELRRQRALLEEGRPAPAVVTGLGRRGKHGREVQYEFLTLGGSRAHGKFGPVHSRKQPEVGSVLAVIYSDDDAKFNKRYPLTLVAVEK
jgi:hypothetical protein